MYDCDVRAARVSESMGEGKCQCVEVCECECVRVSECECEFKCECGCEC